MTYFRFSFPLVAVVLVAAMAISTGCAKSSLRSFSSLFGSSSNTPDDDRSRVADEVANALKGGSAANPTLTIWHESFEDAKAAAQSSGKPILADFTGSDWCHWCVKLKEDVFEKDEFKKWARDKVILLELDYPKRSSQDPAIKQQNAKLAKQYNIAGYPTVLLMSPDGQVLGKLGYNSEVSKWIDSANSILKF